MERIEIWVDFHDSKPILFLSNYRLRLWRFVELVMRVQLVIHEHWCLDSQVQCWTRTCLEQLVFSNGARSSGTGSTQAWTNSKTLKMGEHELISLLFAYTTVTMLTNRYSNSNCTLKLFSICDVLCAIVSPWRICTCKVNSSIMCYCLEA